MNIVINYPLPEPKISPSISTTKEFQPVKSPTARLRQSAIQLQTNETQAGRAKNQRVELKILEIAEIKC